MQFSLLSTLAFAASAMAQGLAFTSFPSTVAVGKPTELTYTATDVNAPARIVLRQGPSTNLETVKTITDSATGGRYTWTPDSSLVNGDNYALEILQGSAFNYGSQFAITGGMAASASSSSSSASSTGSSTSSSSISTRVPIPIQSGSPTLNMTYGAGNVTVAPVTGTMPLNTASGTGAPMNANTTFSSATLSAPTTTGGSGAGATNGPAATTSSGSGAAATSARNSNSAAHFGSSFALIAGAVAAFVFLN